MMSSSLPSRPIFKHMRKGTRSCRECRRRKIRCIYSDSDDKTCQSCSKFHRPCEKQGYSVDRALKAHVSRAELAIERLAQQETVANQKDLALKQIGRIPNSGYPPNHSSIAGGTHDSVFLRLFDVDPLKSVTKPPSTQVNLQTTVIFDDPLLDDRGKLLSVIVDEPHAFDIFKTTGAWWAGWRNQYWALRKASGTLGLTDFVKVKVDSKDPVDVAVGLMCLAQSLLFLRSGIDDEVLQLSLSPKQMMDNILAVIDNVILGSAKYAEHDDIILVALIRAKIYSEDSQARKAIQHLQQALSLAQSQRLGIPGESVIDGNTADIHSQQQTLGAVLEVERFMCMVFGFPYIKDTNFSAKIALRTLESGIDDLMLRTRALRRVSAIVAEQIVDRNTNLYATKFDDSTTSIYRTLTIAEVALSHQWGTDTDMIVLHSASAEAFEMLMTQLWFWTTKMFLFLPAILVRDFWTEELLGLRYNLCLNSARNLLRVFIALRSSPPLSIQVCNCDDFMGVLAGCVLIIGLMQQFSSSSSSLSSLTVAGRAATTTTSTTTTSSSSSSTTTATTFTTNQQQFYEDMDVVENLRDVYRYRASEQGGAIAKQGLKVLDTLLSFFESSEAEETNDVSFGDGRSSTARDTTTNTTAIMLPYFGTIYVQASGRIQVPFAAKCHSGFEEAHYDVSDHVTQWDEWNHFMLSNEELGQDWNEPLFGAADSFFGMSVMS